MKIHFLTYKKRKAAVQVFMLLCFFFMLSTAIAAEIIIIANPSVPVDTLNKTEVMRIFLGKKIRWQDGQKITLAVLKDSDIHNEFTTEFTEKDQHQFKSWWRRRVFTGTGISPRSFDTEEELLQFVSQTGGSVGYISKKQIIDTVKIISIPSGDGDDQ